MKESNFVPADLHIHTPASKCYRGEKNDQEYINILRNYFENGIKVLSITDHNTLKGYKKIKQIESEINQKRKILDSYKEKVPDLKSELESLAKDAQLFEDLLILPGVEMEANPGIHLLFIFSPDQNLSKIDDFLEESGFSSNIQGQELPDIDIKVDVIEAIKRAKELNAITIAAHVDSSKGIYNDLQGAYRARVFKSDDLDGISVNNVIQIEKIKSLIKNPEYKRNKPLAIIQASDHHELIHCGSKITYLNLNELSFSAVAECFKNPTSNISPTVKPEIKNIIDQLANDKNTLLFEEINIEEIQKAACGLLNNHFGSILIGVTNDHYKNIKGIEVENNTIEKIENSIKIAITPEKLFYKLSFEKIPYGVKNLILIGLQSISQKAFLLNGKHFQIGSRGTVIESSHEKLIKFFTNNNSEFLDAFQTSYDSKLEFISNELQLLLESKNNFNLIKKINEDGAIISEIFDIDILSHEEEKILEGTLPYGNHGSNVYFARFSEPRADDCYIRCTCPTTNSLEFDKNNIRSNPCIVLVPGGGVHIIESNNYNLINAYNTYPLVTLSLSHEFNSLNLYVLLAWLKSSTLLWYSYSLFESFDIYTPRVFRSIKIPVSLFHSDTSCLIEKNIKEIIGLEKEFLLEQEQLVDKYDEEELGDVLPKLAQTHNSKVDSFALQIDKIINEKLLINEEDEDIVRNMLILKDLHTMESY